MKKKLTHLGLVLLIFIGISIYYTSSDKPSTTLENASVTLEVQGEILAVNDEDVQSALLSHIGHQKITLKIRKGEYKGQVFETSNSLLGQVDTDTLYKVKDKVLVAIQVKDGEVIKTVPLELYRQPWIFVLFLFFVITLLLYAGIIGLNALLSFLLSIIVLWEIFIKGLLNGYSPLFLTILTVILLSGIIIFLVAGLTKKGIAAFISTIFGLLITLILTVFFGDKIEMYGLTQSYVTSLVISGYYDLDIREIFYSAVVLGASGAAMDISMDIATSMAEIKDKKPDIALKELIQSGINIGRHVIGTMSTTLLLAYSGSYLTLLMLFQVKNSSFIRMINLKMVSAEVMRTLIGSVGLILVAPITALIAGIILTYNFSNKDKSVMREREK